MAEAGQVLAEVTEKHPADAYAWYYLGQVQLRQNKPGAAVVSLQQAVDIDPTLSDGWADLGKALTLAGLPNRAAEAFRKAILYAPRNLDAFHHLMTILLDQGKHQEIIDRLTHARRLMPGNPYINRFLAWELATAPEASLRNGDQAVNIARNLIERQPYEPRFLDVMAAAYAEQGDFNQAVAAAELAIAVAKKNGNDALVKEIQPSLNRYRNGQPFRQRGN